MVLDSWHIFAIVLLPFIVYVGIVIWVLSRLEWKLSNHVKVPGLPILENFFIVTDLKNVLKNFLNFKALYGGIFKINVAWGFSALIISDMKILELLLGSTAILEKSFTYAFLNSWLGNGLLTCPGFKWRKTRKILTPAFHFQILEQYLEAFHSSSGILINKLKNFAGKEAIDVYPLVTLCTLDIICETAMGTKVRAQENTNSEYVKGVKELCRIIVNRSINPMKIFPFFYIFTKDYRIERYYLKILHGYTNSVIKQRREELIKSDGQMPSKSKRLTFLDLLLYSKIDDRPMTDTEIREEVDTFMFAGHDTTASGISFILYCLSKNPEVQQRVVDEIYEVLGNENKIPTIKQLNDMKYLERVIKESLRLFPPVPVYARTPMEDTSYFGGRFPMYSQMIVFTYGVHRDPEHYPNPEVFDPDRFLPENQAERHPYSYLTFSAGPRNCIGQKFAMLEMKSCISHILRHFVLKPAEGFEPEIAPYAVLKSLNGIKMKLEVRT